MRRYVSLASCVNVLAPATRANEMPARRTRSVGRCRMIASDDWPQKSFVHPTPVPRLLLRLCLTHQPLKSWLPCPLRDLANERLRRRGATQSPQVLGAVPENLRVGRLGVERRLVRGVGYGPVAARQQGLGELLPRGGIVRVA